VSVWIYENVKLRIEGQIIGFDEYMNLVMDNAEEVDIKKNTRKPVGKFRQGCSRYLVQPPASPDPESDG
jgi:small nuclear ribonucleoprotein (snRNP)-like protein